MAASVAPHLPVALADQLDRYFQQLDLLILQRQDPVTGLVPASTAITVHGDYTDAWVRDNVYSIQAVWGLGLAYRNAGIDGARRQLLEQSVVRLMRGLLLAMRRQADKVERFKQSLDPRDALHAKYGTRTGEPIVADDQWGHLQLDATSLYLLMLAQMTCAGLRIVRDQDEVSFVQNLVYYIERAYRTPDYGIWERGNKLNNGQTEINASSVGMATAALEAMRGLDLFGADGDAHSRIFVAADEIARARASLQALLPCESLSKEVDAALLAIVGYPAFAVADTALAQRTREQVVAKLAGQYGLKRFLLDGHQTAVEDHRRLHYEDGELKHFAGIESEWPLFYGYLMLDALFRGDHAAASEYRVRLRMLAVPQAGFAQLPELYYVPATAVMAERANPGSQPRQANRNLPLVWAQSLFVLAELIADGLLACADLDPLQRHKRKRFAPATVHLAIMAETVDVKRRLAVNGIAAQTPAELPGICIADAEGLARVLQQVGCNDKLKLSGRPLRPLGSLTTARAYCMAGRVHLFYHPMQRSQRDFLSADARLLLTQLRAELAYIARNWQQAGTPLMLIPLREAELNAVGTDALRALLQELQADALVQLSTVSAVLPDLVSVDLSATWPEANPQLDDNRADRDYLPFDPAASCGPLPPCLDEPMSLAACGQRLLATRQLPLQLRLLQAQVGRYGLDQDSGILTGKALSYRQLLQETYRKAIALPHWSAARLAAGLLKLVHVGLDDAATELIAHGRQLVFGGAACRETGRAACFATGCATGYATGRATTAATTAATPLDNDKLQALILRYCCHGSPESMLNRKQQCHQQALLNQELLLYLAALVRGDPMVLHGTLSIRIGELSWLLVSEFSRERQLSHDDAFERLCSLAPHVLYQRLAAVVAHSPALSLEPAGIDRQQPRSSAAGFSRPVFTAAVDPTGASASIDWQQWRLRAGVIGRYPAGFHAGIWQVLHHCTGIIIGGRYAIPRVIDATAVHGTSTQNEPGFALQLEALLNALPDPVYRHVTAEALQVLIACCRANPALRLDACIDLDALLNNAAKCEWLPQPPIGGEPCGEHRQAAWNSFCLSPPHRMANAVAHAIGKWLDAARLPSQKLRGGESS